MAAVELAWRAPVTSTEVNRLHAAAFETRLFDDDEWDWAAQLEANSLGWVTARLDGRLVGFTNVVADGLVHAWIQDVMVDPTTQRGGVGTLVVAEATRQCREAGYEWLHVDFDDHLADFYYRSCGFRPTNAGLIEL